MKTQITKQHTSVVAVQPLTTFHKENRMKKQSSTTLKLAIVFAMVVTMALSAVAQDEVVGPPTPYQNPLQIALKEWYPANTSATVTGLFPGGGTFNGPNLLVFDGSNIWVNYDGANGNKVDKLQASDDKFIGSYQVGGTGSKAYPGAFDGVYIWAPDHNSTAGTVYKIRAADGAVTSCGLGSANPIPMAAAFDGKSVWVSTYYGNVVKFDPNTCAVQCSRTVAAGSRMYGLAFDGNSMWATASDTNQVIKLNSSCGGTAISVPAGPVGIVWDGANLWTANQGASSISQISNGALSHTYALGYQPAWIAYDGANVWTTDATAGRVSKMSTSSPGPNPPTYQTCGSASSNPLGIAFDGAHMWVACYGTNQLGKM